MSVTSCHALATQRSSSRLTPRQRMPPRPLSQLAPPLTPSHTSARPHLRPYQQRMVNEVGGRSVVVKMPTGSGKTLVAAECIRRALTHPGTLALFLVPTCDLVAQQAHALRSWCGLRVAEFMGGEKAPAKSTFDVLATTPEAFRRLQQREKSTFGWPRFKMCVFDEVHHVLKDHPYRKLAHGLLATCIRERPQVIGLSASLTYAVGEQSVQRALQSLSQDLGLEGMLSVSDEELLAGGFVPPRNDVEVVYERVLPEGVVPEDDRRPHLMYKTFFDRVSRGEATPFSQALFSVVMALEDKATKIAPGKFSSPLNKQCLSAWETYANQLSNEKSLVANKKFFLELENWYVALRLLVSSWEEHEMAALQWLHHQGAFDVNLSSKTTALRDLRDRLHDLASRSKLTCLKEQLLEKQEWVRSRGGEIRAIVFVQNRIMAHVLTQWISADPDLSLVGLSAGYVAARNATITPRLKVTAQQATDVVERFRLGAINVLVATSVIEEGFDVPEANVVISFDSLKNSVELAQRFGRARQAERRIVAMDERRDRPIARLEEVRREQDLLIEKFQPGEATRNIKADRAAQCSREMGARHLLLDLDWNDMRKSALSTFNLYVKKTKAMSTEEFQKTTDGHLFELTYKSALRDYRAEGRSMTKKAAKLEGTIKMLTLLDSQDASSSK
ncbi:MAG: hypothetical protein SGPRY_001923 [Prymnesium sp.]